MAPSLTYKLKYKRSTRDPTKFDINEFLSRTDDGNGKCRTCNKRVPWSRDRVSSHKRASCPAASENEVTFFKGVLQQKREHREVNHVVVRTTTDVQSDATIAAPPPSPAKRSKQRTVTKATVTSWVDTRADRARITEAMANFVFRTGAPFRVVESEAMKELLCALRPAYVPFAPTAKAISGSILTWRYGHLFGKGLAFVAGTNTFTLSSDGWSDINGEHMVN
ncbi:hypothetical protein PR001_g23145 [Phytophthora rubi]|uniref:BED-type domain-containing protein n=1 Tax=Phytophthora rubi TaxID=129364 RepID=A0A6A3IK89_9STRA|nr:hypothetical protein PR002_g23512 [Phytophthora rubi]KAE8984538.1 hypothetical protein PR001_g23145 [Phytophthora rubi]